MVEYTNMTMAEHYESNATDHSDGHGVETEVDDRTVPQHIVTWVTFFVVTQCAKNFGPYMPRLGLPMITAYIIVGAAVGPFSLNIVQDHDLKSLSYINMIAMAYITTSAGAELVIKDLRATIWKLLAQVTCIAFLTLALCTVTVGLLATTPLMAFVNDYEGNCRWSVALVMASICVARSPATAIAIVRELKCKGRFTTTFLGITVLSDLFVLISYTLATSYTKSTCSGEPFDGGAIGIVIAMIIVSIIIGVLVGFAFILLMRSRHLIIPAFILPIGFCIFYASAIFTKEVSQALEHKYEVALEPLLICIVAGFVTVNFSRFHHRFEEVLNLGAPYVFLPFFTLVGASLDLQTFVNSLAFAVILSIVRMSCIFMGTSLPGHFVGQPKNMNMTIWMTLISQAGFSLGLAAQVAVQFEGWGRQFQAVIISCVVVNQLIGPILCKLAMKWSGEAGKSSGEEALNEQENDPHAKHIADDNKVIILGSTPTSLAVAIGFLKKRWGVTMLTETDIQADRIMIEIREWADISKYAKDEKTSDIDGTEHVREAQNIPSTTNLLSLVDGFSVRAVETHDGRMHPLGRSQTLRSLVENKIEALVVGEGEEGPALGMEVIVEKDCEDDHIPAGRKLSGISDDDVNGPTPTLMPQGSLGSIDGAEAANREILASCEDIRSSIDEVAGKGLQTIVLALQDDLIALELLDDVQQHLADTNSAALQQIRFVVLLHDLRWVECFLALGAIPIHDFVLSTHSSLVMATTPYNKDCVLLPAAADNMALCEEYSNIFDREVLVQCYHESSEIASLSVQPSSQRLLNRLQEKTERRTKTGLFNSVEKWIHDQLQQAGALNDEEGGRLSRRPSHASGVSYDASHRNVTGTPRQARSPRAGILRNQAIEGHPTEISLGGAIVQVDGKGATPAPPTLIPPPDASPQTRRGLGMSSRRASDPSLLKASGTHVIPTATTRFDDETASSDSGAGGRLVTPLVRELSLAESATGFVPRPPARESSSVSATSTSTPRRGLSQLLGFRGRTDSTSSTESHLTYKARKPTYSDATGGHVV